MQHSPHVAPSQMAPVTVAYACLGSAPGTLAEALSGRVEGAITGHLMFWVGLAAIFVVVLLLARVASVALRAATEGTDFAPPAQTQPPTVSNSN